MKLRVTKKGSWSRRLFFMCASLRAGCRVAPFTDFPLTVRNSRRSRRRITRRCRTFDGNPAGLMKWQYLPYSECILKLWEQSRAFVEQAIVTANQIREGRKRLEEYEQVAKIMSWFPGYADSIGCCLEDRKSTRLNSSH